MDEARHTQERGAILCALKQEYGGGMVPLRTLASALNLVGMPMTMDSLQFSLTLLADLGYVRIWRAEELGLWRADRANEIKRDSIIGTKLLPRGLNLVDGRIAPDASVSF